MNSHKRSFNSSGPYYHHQQKARRIRELKDGNNAKYATDEALDLLDKLLT
jgi:hypothetical protein